MKPRRRWFRYSLRTFFVLLTIFGVWLGVQLRIVQKRRELWRWIEKQDIVGTVQVQYLAPPATLPWARALLGDRLYDEPRLLGPDVDRQKLREVDELLPEARIVVDENPHL